ncbi:TetR/AcrR family transcriptional regulator [Salipaludibacillus agaradhaerens]|uniref:TetR/AcrR family transcriptional regulator n=1 Tax=Salipaludibacillus agaradhaerens TaxID=76935 RepID=UPI002151459E|nr:TetR/AcrR family transcriptional regulator [Salipaludibacillus agaradhaerens]MCR6105044.1 TetR/AcrR family transcriptional regulator [Salipaludibacillus agaradhaerens]MCR6117089.1 TetR/AcrR family transcriptional regulator [Salipaludibacillus agaradhaerens]
MPLSEAQKEKMKQKRARILQTAIVLFAEAGYEGTTIKQVAAKAGVSFGSVFTYFETKETLFHAAVTEPLDHFSKKIMDFDDASEKPLEELENMIGQHIATYASLSAYLNLVSYVISHHNLFPETFEELDAFHETLKRKVARLVENGQQKGVLLEQEIEHTVTGYTSLLMGLRLNLIDEPASDLWAKFIPIALQLFGPRHH